MAQRRDVLGIQYLRAVAALMVVVYHAAVAWTGRYDGMAGDTLKSGVDIFFVISGFVMVYSTRGGQISVKTFLTRRLVRIIPLYWAVTLFMIVVLLAAPGLVNTSQLRWPHALASLAFIAVPNPASPLRLNPLVTPGWTLNLEMFFYLIFAVGVGVARGSLRALLLVVAVPLVALSAIGLLARPVGFVGFYTNPVMLDFLFGMALGGFYIVRQPRLDWRVGLLIVAASFVLLILPPQGDIVLRPFRFGLLAWLIVAVAVFSDLPRWNVLHLLGDSSYALYLTHFFVISAFKHFWKHAHVDSAVAFHLAALLVAVGIGLFCWRFIETPLTRAARALADRA